MAEVNTIKLRWLVPVSSRGKSGHSRAPRARPTRVRGARFKRRKFKTNMAARGFFRTRFLLCCFKQNSYISKIISTSTTSVNPLYSRQIVSGVQCSSFKGMFKGKTTIDRDADWELKDSQYGYKSGEPTYYHKLSRLIIFATFCGLYLVCSTGTAYAGERDEDKQHDKSRRRHKGCFASKRRIQSVKNLVTAEKGRSQVNEN